MIVPERPTAERRLKVLFLVDTLETGGTERSLIEIAAHLEGVEAVICHIYPGSALKAAAEQAGVRVISLDLRGKYAPIPAVKAILRVIRAERPDLLHTALVRADLFGRVAGKLTATPVVGSFVSEMYGSRRSSTAAPSKRVKLLVFELLDRFTARWVHSFVAVSRRVATTEGANLRVSPSRIHVIPRGRKLPSISAAEVTSIRRTVRDELEVQPEARIAILVSRLIPTKGHGELLSAFRSIQLLLPRLHLLFVGEGPSRPDIERQIRDQALDKQVHLLGSRHDVPRLLAASDAFVFPTRLEGHPGALVEALLAGLPPIVSDIPVHREFLEDGVTAMFFPVGDVDGMGKAILRVFSDEEGARRIGEYARSMAEERFEISRVARRYEELFRAVVSEDRRGM